jgi:two-component system nitrate/nitrite response regulator NarL
MASSPHARVHSPTVQPHPRLRAVVADDIPHMLDFISAVAEIEGRVEVVATATNGIGAIRAAQRLTPDLVILDVSMPLMNGFEAAVHIKRRLPGAKVLLLSADDDPELGLSALDCGADAFIWKGSFITQCRKQLERMFSDSR